MVSCEPDPTASTAGPNVAVMQRLWSILSPFDDTDAWDELEADSFEALDDAANEPVQWYVWSRAVTFVATSGTENPVSAVMSRGVTASPYKLQVVPGIDGIADNYILDVGCSVVTPPAPSVNVSILVPSTSLWGANSQEFAFPSGVTTAWISRVSVYACPLYAPSRPNRPARCTRKLYIAAGTGDTLPIPPHASRVYVSPLPLGTGAEPLGMDFRYNAGAGAFNWGPLLVGEWFAVPTGANEIAIQGDPDNETGVVAVFELEV